MYLSYAEYQSMGGTLTQTTFNDFEFEAETLIDWYTFSRLKKFSESDYPDALKRCMYHIIQSLVSQSLLIGSADTTSADSISSNSTISSQSNDGVSVSYNVLSAKDLMDANKTNVEQTINRYLSNVTDSLGRKVLYRGIYADE